MANDPISYARTTQVRLRRGTTAQIAANPPIEAEPFYDLTEKRIGVGGTTEIIEQWKSQFLEHTADATNAVARNMQEKLDEIISVKDFGAVGDGVTDDLAALNRARDAAASKGAVLFFPYGVYAISDTFRFADGGNAFFHPSSKIKLLNSTSTGGAVSGPSTVQTKRICIENITVDCDGIPGENALGFGHAVGARLLNVTVLNCVHDAVKFGGKGLQFEGIPCKNVQVIGLNAENCTVGIDVGAFQPSTDQTVHISIYDVSMKNVDIPVYINDTYALTAADNYDAIEVYIDGLHCRNCGKLTYPGAPSATGGGIFVADRGYKTTVRNVQIVNDTGLAGSTDYGGIGALTRGSWKGLILENVLFAGTYCGNIFDFNVATFQAPSLTQTDMYVLANNVRIYANADYIVNGPTGASRIGDCRLEGVEIGSTLATLAGIIAPNAQTYTAPVLEVIDRDNDFKSTGLRSFNRLAAMGNLLSSTAIVGEKAPSIARGVWTPVDGSGAGLSFTNTSGHWFRIGEMVVATGTLTYPSTADGTAAKIGGFPFAFENIEANRVSGSLTLSTVAGVQKIYPELTLTTAPLLSETSAGVTNADCSGGIFGFCVTYLARQ